MHIHVPLFLCYHDSYLIEGLYGTFDNNNVMPFSHKHAYLYVANHVVCTVHPYLRPSALGMTASNSVAQCKFYLQIFDKINGSYYNKLAVLYNLLPKESLLLALKQPASYSLGMQANEGRPSFRKFPKRGHSKLV